RHDMAFMNGSSWWRAARARTTAALAAIPLATVALPGKAATEAQARAHGIEAALSLLPVLGPPDQVAAGPLPAGVGGNAPPAFDDTGSAAGVSLPLGPLGEVLSTGALSAHAAADLAAGTATAESEVDGLALRLSVAGLLDLLALEADVLRTSAAASCVAGVPAFSGSTWLEGATLRVARLPVPIAELPLPDSVVAIPLAGLALAVNVQHASAQGLVVQGLRLDSSGAGILPGLVLEGSVVVGHAEAGLAGCGSPLDSDGDGVA